MSNNKRLSILDSELGNVFISFIFGYLTGAVMLILLAPKSGKDIRIDIQNKGIELRDQSSEMMGDAMTQVHSNVDQFLDDSREMINDLRSNGQEIVLEQFGHKSKATKDETISS